MILSIRVDDRLIHGQVALVWTKEFNASRIVVANDEAATNQLMQATLQMATPTGIKLLIKSVSESISIFNDPRAQELKLFVLTNCIADALKIVQECENVNSVNVANVGRFDKVPNSEKTKLNSNVFVSKAELEALKVLVTMPLPVYHQVIPSNSKVTVEHLIKNLA